MKKLIYLLPIITATGAEILFYKSTHMPKEASDGEIFFWVLNTIFGILLTAAIFPMLLNINSNKD